MGTNMLVTCRPGPRKSESHRQVKSASGGDSPGGVRGVSGALRQAENHDRSPREGGEIGCMPAGGGTPGIRDKTLKHGTAEAVIGCSSTCWAAQHVLVSGKKSGKKIRGISELGDALVGARPGSRAV